MKISFLINMSSLKPFVTMMKIHYVPKQNNNVQEQNQFFNHNTTCFIDRKHKTEISSILNSYYLNHKVFVLERIKQNHIKVILFFLKFTL